MVHYKVKNIVSNLPANAKHQDTLLVNSWGITIQNKNIWIADNGTGYLTSYSLDGKKLQSVTVSVGENEVPNAAPTGLVNNFSQDFKISNGSILVPSILLTATENGTVNAYNPFVDFSHANVVIDNPSSVYKGLALAPNRLFLADFGNNKVQVYDGNFQPVLFSSFGFIPFNDPTIPADYSVFNVVNINDRIFVLYAKRSTEDPNDDAAGIGFGIINEFTVGGVLVRRFTSNGVLNAPWALTKAPSHFGLPSDTLIIGNFGDGKINAFSFSGRFLKTLSYENKQNIVLEGLWGLVPYKHKLYFASGPEDESNGLVGKIKKD